jgi:hypothetical protein
MFICGGGGETFTDLNVSWPCPLVLLVKVWNGRLSVGKRTVLSVQQKEAEHLGLNFVFGGLRYHNVLVILRGLHVERNTEVSFSEDWSKTRAVQRAVWAPTQPVLNRVKPSQRRTEKSGMWKYRTFLYIAPRYPTKHCMAHCCSDRDTAGVTVTLLQWFDFCSDRDTAAVIVTLPLYVPAISHGLARNRNCPSLSIRKTNAFSSEDMTALWQQ